MLRLLLAASAVASVAGVLLLGLPGALVYQAFSAVMQKVAFPAVKPDAAWPIALLVTVLGPWGGPLGYVVLQRFSLTGKKPWILAFFELVWLLVVCLLVTAIPE